MSARQLELAKVEEMRTLIHKVEAVDELIEVVDFNFKWLLRFCERNNIEIPDRERVYESLNKIRVLIDRISPANIEQSSTEVERFKKSTEDETAPPIDMAKQGADDMSIRGVRTRTGLVGTS